MPTIAILGTFDTKGEELAFVADLIRRRGHQPLAIDVGIFAPRAGFRPDVPAREVAAAAGFNLDLLSRNKDRGEAVRAMTLGAPAVVQRLAAQKGIHGIISLGGGGGTAIGTAAMRVLPVGFPKVMVSTLASGNTEQYVGVKDVVMFPSIVDLSGLNRVSRLILTRAAGAICGMVEAEPAIDDSRPVIVASMFGNTTPCVEHARALLEARGYEVLVFHATGTGGRTMESLIEAGLTAGVLDITTTEWADELVGGVLSAGPHRLEAAGKARVPALIAPGCLDMVNFWAPETVPARFKERRFYPHNPQVTLMRTSLEESAELGRILAEKINAYTAPVTVALPLRGISAIGAPGGPFHDPAADGALFGSLKKNLEPGIPVVEMDCAINDPAFAAACAEALLKILTKGF